MIVDVAVDSEGENMYQVHESTRSVRLKMPISNFVAMTPDETRQLRSPTDISRSSALPGSDEYRLLASGSTATTFDFPPSSHANSSESDALLGEDNVWAKDVSDAFKDALAIVPKNGLSKIKIAGKCCGRNELISDYILAKTGKFRLRKQVSSHIQVVKNMRSDKHLITLINDGPTFQTEEEAERNNKLFEDVFLKINMEKSLGIHEGKRSSSAVALDKPEKRQSPEVPVADVKRRKPSMCHVGVPNITFQIDDKVGGFQPMCLTIQSRQSVECLTIKENAAIANRFPKLEQFSNSNVPVLHNMVNIYWPDDYLDSYSLEHGLRTSYQVDLSEPGVCLSSYTSVYSFGTEVLKVHEADFQANTLQPFLLKFWKCFFLQLIALPQSIGPALKGITVKQVIYDNSDGVSDVLYKNKIKAVLLWEFARVTEQFKALLLTLRLLLPPQFAHVSDNSNYSIRPVNNSYLHVSSRASFDNGVNASAVSMNSHQASSLNSVNSELSQHQYNYNMGPYGSSNFGMGGDTTASMFAQSPYTPEHISALPQLSSGYGAWAIGPLPPSANVDLGRSMPEDQLTASYYS